LDLIQGRKSAGSRSIKTLIQRVQPVLTLHGHIHESPELSGTYLDWIGETLSVNPGQSAWSGKEITKLHAVVFEIEDVEGTLTHTCFSKMRSDEFGVRS
jgi:Icc-related predicted phosphoesterase